MTQIFTVTGMTCSSCEDKVKSGLLTLPSVMHVEVSKEDKTAVIESKEKIELNVLQQAIGGLQSQYQITSKTPVEDITTKSWIETYKPVFLIFLYIFIVTILIQFKNSYFDSMEWMRHFMAGFFLTFSFFKMLNLKEFASSYQMYDVIAKIFPAWAYIYGILEFLLGVAFVIDYNPMLLNWITLIIMSISIIGVLQSVLNKRKIKCACLGAVFNLPMSTVTIIEDALMIIMSALMIISLN